MLRLYQGKAFLFFRHHIPPRLIVLFPFCELLEQFDHSLAAEKGLVHLSMYKDFHELAIFVVDLANNKEIHIPLSSPFQYTFCSIDELFHKKHMGFYQTMTFSYFHNGHTDL